MLYCVIRETPRKHMTLRGFFSQTRVKQTSMGLVGTIPRHFIMLASCLLSLLAGASTDKTHATMRLAIALHESTISLQAAQIQCAPSLHALQSAPTYPHALNIQATGGGMTLGEIFYPHDHLFCRAHTGILRLGDQQVPGTLHIVRTMREQRATLTAVQDIPMPEYLHGVLRGEMQANWPIEALRAQAVASRSYALARQRAQATQAYDVVASVNDQVYRPDFVPAPRIAAAVSSTQGEVLQNRGSVATTYFHSHCGGHTAHPQDVWAKTAPSGIRAVTDPHCHRSPHQSWSHTVTLDTLANALHRNGYGLRDITAIEPLFGERSARMQTVNILTTGEPMQLAANEFRRIIGYRDLKSTKVAVEAAVGGWTFHGQGYGHGVGMCQWGAKGMADEGKSYRNILAFYYPELTLVKRY